jgi:outer membrane protein TolC
MKQILIFLLTVSTSFLRTQEHIYTFAECQQAALKHSEDLTVAEMQILIDQEKINQIQGINLPKLSAEGRYQARDNHPGGVHKNPAYGQHRPEEQENHEHPHIPKHIKSIGGDKETTSSKLSLIVPIYDFGRVSNMVSAQKHTVEADRFQKDNVQQELLLTMAQSYYRALEGKKIEEVVEKSQRLLEQQLHISQDFLSAGLVTKNDVLGVEVQLAQRQQERIQALHNTESSLASLCRLTGFVIDSTSQIEDVSTDIHWAASLQQLLSTSDDHPDLQKISAQTESAKSAYDAIFSENLPKITAFADANNCSDSHQLHKNWLTAGIGIQIPLIEGGITMSKMAQKKQEIDQLGFVLKGTQENIHLAVRKAFLQVDNAYSKIPVAQKSILLAEENLRISKDQYEEGFLSSDDLLNDETRLAQARSNYFQSLYEFYLARTTLDYAAGILKPLPQGTV